MADAEQRVFLAFTRLGMTLLAVTLQGCASHDAPGPSGQSAGQNADVGELSVCRGADAGVCPQGLTCAIYCDGAVSKFGCRKPAPGDVGIGEACRGKVCGAGVCASSRSDADARCLGFCTPNGECNDGQMCDAVSLSFACSSGRESFQVSVCRPRP